MKYFGMTAYQALKCGSVNGALCMGIADHVGMLKEGFDADILVLKENPFVNVSCVADFELVIKGGCVHDRAWCNDLLKTVRERPRTEIIPLMPEQ